MLPHQNNWSTEPSLPFHVLRNVDASYTQNETAATIFVEFKHGMQSASFTGVHLVQEYVLCRSASRAGCRSTSCTGVCLVQECVLYRSRPVQSAGVRIVQEYVLYRSMSCTGMRLVYECVLCRNASCTGMRPVRGKLRYATDQQLAYAK